MRGPPPRAGRLFAPLRPIELIVVAATALAWALAWAWGRSYDLLFVEGVQMILVQLTWLAPCLVFRALAALWALPPRRARLFYLVYFGLLTAVLFGWRIGSLLTELYLVEGLGRMVQAAGFVDAALLALLLGAYLVHRRRRPEHARAVMIQQAVDALFIGRLLLGFILVVAVYSNLSAMVPLINPVDCTPLFHRLDRALFLGHDPFALLAPLHSPALTELMRESYYFFFMFIVFGLGAAVLFGGPGDFERIYTGFALVYVVGAAIYLLTPSVGPAFHEATRHLLPPAAKGSMIARHETAYLVFLRNPQTAPVFPFNGLAAFPSLHIAHSLFFLWHMRRLEWVLVLLLAAPFALLALSTVYLGWHWVVDLPGGALLAAVSVWLAARLCPPARCGAGPPEHEAQP